MRGPAGLRSPSRHQFKKSILRLPMALGGQLTETVTSVRRRFLGSSESSKSVDPAQEAKASLRSVSINLSITSTVPGVAAVHRRVRCQVQSDRDGIAVAITRTHRRSAISTSRTSRGDKQRRSCRAKMKPGASLLTWRSCQNCSVSRRPDPL